MSSEGVAPSADGPEPPAAALRQALASLRDVLAITDEHLRFAYVSPSVAHVLGHRAADLVGRSVYDAVHPDEHDTLRSLIRERFAHRTGGTIVHRSPHADGSYRYLETMIHVVEEGTRIAGAAFIARDVTPRVHEEQRLARELAFRQALVGLTNELLATSLDARFYRHALERTVALVPDAQAGSLLLRRDDGWFTFEVAVGFDLAALAPLRLSPYELGRREPPQVERLNVATGVDRIGPEKLAHFEAAGRHDEIRVALSVPLLVGDVVHGYLNLDNFERADAFDANDQGIAEAIAAQVSVALQRRLLERQLEAERARFELLAIRDPLTALPNRRLFHDRLAQALARTRRRGQRFALAYLDLDGFKQVNDLFGHDAGDALLRTVATTLAVAVRGEDTVARLGGDEFGVLLADVGGAAEAAAVARKLVVALRGPLAAFATARPVGASIGVAVCPDDGEDVDALLRAADRAMYRVKAAGGGGVAMAAADEAAPRGPSAAGDR